MTMFIKYISVALLGIFSQPNDHDISLSFFRIYQAEETLILEVTLERDEIADELNMEVGTITANDLESYLKENCEWVINGAEKEILIEGFEFKDDHFLLSIILDNSGQRLSSLLVRNTCLIGISNHSNIIQLDLAPKQRDFRMHKNRTQIEVEVGAE